MNTTRTLYLVICAAGPAAQFERIVEPAQAQGWQVQVIATPAALDFFDAESAERLTGRPVRSRHRTPGTPRSPRAEAVVVAPASFNTTNKLAGGVADNYALDVLNEAIGHRLPVVLLPFVNAAYARRLPFRHSVDLLRNEGVDVLLGEGAFAPHPPGQGGEAFEEFPWGLALERAVRSSR